MNYDVFISYSRHDSQEVETLIELLRDSIPDIRIWYDIEGIETAEIFQSKIISAIDNSSLVIFACSDNSLKSEFCRKEVIYAKNLDKKVVPYLLKDAKLKDWFLFEFGLVNYVDSQKDEDVQHLIYDIKNWISSVTDSSVKETQLQTKQVDHKKKPWWKRRSFKFTLIISVSFCVLACVFFSNFFVIKTGSEIYPNGYGGTENCSYPCEYGVYDEPDLYDQEYDIDCDLCIGTGTIKNHICPKCNGRGQYHVVIHDNKIDTIR